MMLNRINNIYGAPPIKGSKGGRACVSPEASEGSDQFSVSPFAREMASMASELGRMPDVRTEKVENIRNDVDAGKYVPDSMKIASRLVWAGILEQGE